MSDKDLIKREEVADKAFEILGMLTEAERQNKIDRTLFSLLYHDIGAIAFLPAVPHEMTAREFLREMIRLRQVCTGHTRPPKLDDNLGADVDEAVAIVEKWAREHPEGVANE